jgi:hypothetical protein
MSASGSPDLTSSSTFGCAFFLAAALAGFFSTAIATGAVHRLAASATLKAIMVLFRNVDI